MNAAKSGLRTFIRHSLLHLDAEAGLTDEQIINRRRRRIETVIAVCWALIALKTFVVVWAVNYYAVPINPMWIIAPTLAFAMLATALYYILRD